MICLSGKQQTGSIYRKSMPKKFLQGFIPSMMANSAKEPFDSPDWIFEVKRNGYRGIAVFDAAGKPHLWSRNDLPLHRLKFELVRASEPIN